MVLITQSRWWLGWWTWTSTIPLSNTAWVNFDISASVPASRIFKTYDEAITWIQANWTPWTTPRKVELPWGNVGDICMYSNIFVSWDNGTTIDTLTSDTTFTWYNDILATTLDNVVINSLAIADGKCIYMKNIIIKDIVPVPDGWTAITVIENSFVLWWDMLWYSSPLWYFNTKFLGLTPITNLTWTFRYCDIQASSYIWTCVFNHCSTDIWDVDNWISVSCSHTILTENILIDAWWTLVLENSDCLDNIINNWTLTLHWWCYIKNGITWNAPIIAWDWYEKSADEVAEWFTETTIPLVIKEINDKIINREDITAEPTGFTNPEWIRVTYNSTTKTITLNWTFVAYYKGKVVSELVDWRESEPMNYTTDWTYFLYYCNGVFTFDKNPRTFDCLQIAFVLINSHEFAIRECHWFMQRQSHKELHEIIGTYLSSWWSLISWSYTLNDTTARNPLVEKTIIYDEDLSTSLTHTVVAEWYTQKYLTSTNKRVFLTDQTTIIPVSWNNPYRNQLTGWTQSVKPNWTQKLMNNNDYACVWLVAIPTTADTESQKYRFVWVQPQQVGTLASQRLLSPTSLNLWDVTTFASEYVFLDKIIIKYVDNNRSIAEVEKLTGTKCSQVWSPSGAYLTLVTTDSTLSGLGTSTDPLTLTTNWTILATLWTTAPTLYDTQATYKVYEYTYWTTKYYRRVYNTYDPATDTFYTTSALTTAVCSRALTI